MSDSNRLQLSRVTESTIGTTPGSTVATKIRVTGENFVYDISNVESEEIRSDRLTTDLIQVGGRVTGGFNFELSYGAFDEEIESAMFSTWLTSPVKLNLTSDSSITQVTDSTDTYAVDAGGASFVACHLVRASGFGSAANNQLFRVASSTAATIVGTSLTLTDEAAPPAGARLKVVGFQGASGDITAAASGLSSTALNFTTLGLRVGQWIKIGGTAAGNKFATAQLNDFVRITAISATALTCDNLPATWTTDAGTGKTIQVWVSDVIRVGTTKKAFSFEKAIMSQASPYYMVNRGCIVNRMTLSFASQRILTGTFEFLGFDVAGSLTSMDSSPDEAAQNDVLSASANVGRIAEAGVVAGSPNFIQEINMTLNNNLREQTAVGSLGLIGHGVGKVQITGTLRAYFGDSSLLAKYFAGTATSLNARVAKSGKAMIHTFPNVKFNAANANASAQNQDVIQEIQFTALRDAATATSYQIDRFEEYAV